jgi:cytochrome P450
MALQPTKV